MEARSQVAFVRANGPLDERTRRGVRWAEGLERATGLRAGLVTPQAKNYVGLLQEFGRGRPSTSVRTASHVGDGPLLVYCTGLDGLAKFGRRRPLVYIAWGSDRWLDGWAASLCAIDITTQQSVAGPAEQVRDLLDHLDIAGNNGWFDAPGKRDARQILAELDRLVDRDYTVGAMLAVGHSKHSLEGLKNL